MGKTPGEICQAIKHFRKLVSSESRRKKLGKSEFYDVSVIPANPNSNRVPGSRANYGKSKGKDKPEGKSNFRTGKGANWIAEMGENNEGNYQLDQEEERGDQNEEDVEMEVTQARGGNGVESDIDWNGVDTHTDSEIGTNLVNNTQARDFAELRGPQDVEAYKAFRKEQISRVNKGKKDSL